MRLIQILGPGCSRCERLAANAEAAVERLHLDARVEKVTDMDQITTFRVLRTPALVIDGAVKVVGRVPSPEEIEKLLQ